MACHINNDTDLGAAWEVLSNQGLDGLGRAVEILLNTAMQLERNRHLDAEPYQRTAQRQGYANGFKPKSVKSRLGVLGLAIPQVRDSSFYPSSLEKGLRSERALKLALAEMYVQGVSTRKVAAITEALCGFEVSSTEVSQAAKLLDQEIQEWQSRRLGSYRYVFLDALYEKVREAGQVIDHAILVAIGITAEGKREILGVSAALSEAEVHWRGFLTKLQERGMHGVELFISDAHAGLAAARRAVYPSIPWQRCQFHLQQNAQGYISKRSEAKAVHEAIRTIFNAPNEVEAKRFLDQAIKLYQTTMPKLAAWLENNIPEGLTVFLFPPEHQRRLRTTNTLERFNREIRRRTKTVSIFPNTKAAERLIASLAMEQSEEWLTGKTYLNMSV
jgi:putative transposase